MEKATVYSDDRPPRPGTGIPGRRAAPRRGPGRRLCRLAEELEAIIAIRSAIKIPIEVGGGIRDMSTVRKLVSIGIDRIILGTARSRTLVRPGGLQRLPGKIIVGIDAKDGWWPSKAGQK